MPSLLANATPGFQKIAKGYHLFRVANVEGRVSKGAKTKGAFQLKFEFVISDEEDPQVGRKNFEYMTLPGLEQQEANDSARTSANMALSRLMVLQPDVDWKAYDFPEVDGDRVDQAAMAELREHLLLQEFWGNIKWEDDDQAPDGQRDRIATFQRVDADVIPAYAVATADDAGLFG